MKPLSDKQKIKLADELEKSGLTYKDLMTECQRIASRALSQIPIGDARIDKETREILVGANRIPLSAKEFGVFNLLHLNSNSPVTRLEIARAVWGHEGTEKNHSIDVCVNHLRTKMEQAELPGYIKTVPSKGYMIDLINPSNERAPKVDTPKPTSEPVQTVPTQSVVFLPRPQEEEVVEEITEGVIEIQEA
jgi:DNA-binding winged helix-turn-helix (wHTH) protein